MANATTKPTIDVLELLTSQHAEVDTLFEKLEKKQGDQKAVFAELANKLAAHAKIEETIFYPAVMAKQTDDMLHESVEEHLQIKRVLSDMLVMKVTDENFEAKLSVLKEDVSHHAHEEEEEKLFTLLRRTMSTDELGALGNECMALFETLMAGNPSSSVPSETIEAAPLPKVA